MLLEDFSALCNLLVENNCPVRDIPLIFNQSIKIQANEIDFDRHLCINFPEFIESLSRVIDRSISKETKLVEKLELFKEKIHKLIGSSQEVKHVKEKFVYPKKNEETNLYDFDYNSNFYNSILFTNNLDSSIAYSNMFSNTLNSESFKGLKNYIESKTSVNNLQSLSMLNNSKTNLNLNEIKENDEDEDNVNTIRNKIKSNILIDNNEVNTINKDDSSISNDEIDDIDN